MTSLLGGENVLQNLFIYGNDSQNSHWHISNNSEKIYILQTLLFQLHFVVFQTKDSDVVKPMLCVESSL